MEHEDTTVNDGYRVNEIIASPLNVSNLHVSKVAISGDIKNRSPRVRRDRAEKEDEGSSNQMPV